MDVQSITNHRCLPGQHLCGRGLLGQLGERLKALGFRRCLAITDSTVDRIWGDTLRAGLRHITFVYRALPAGESSKSLAMINELYSFFLEEQAERATVVLAVGGGVVSDLVGFAASTFMRGLPLCLVPTTLLGMVDASIGGKNGVDLPQGKNLVGSFYEPQAIWADWEALNTLPAEEIACGLAETVKTALLGSAELYYALTAEPTLIWDSSCQSLQVQRLWQSYFAQAMGIKAKIVEEDLREKGKRAWLNLGHTWGHALEVAGGYVALKHGQAVALGLLASIMLAERLAILEEPLLTGMARTLKAWGLPTQIPESIAWEDFATALVFDKKRLNGQNVMILPVRAGLVRVVPVTEIADIKSVFLSLSAKNIRGCSEE